MSLYCIRIESCAQCYHNKVYQLLAQGRLFSPGTPASSTTKSGRHDIAESGIKHNQSIYRMFCSHRVEATPKQLIENRE